MRRRSALVSIAAAALGLSALSGAAATPVLAATCGAGAGTLLDGGFETPVVGAGTFAQPDASLVPPWQTTDSKNEIEIWGTGFLGVPAAEGGQFNEINANSAGTLYQDVVTTPGEAMTWTIQHRGREGTDTMKVLIGDAATADVNSDVGWDYFSSDLADDASAWVTHTAAYVVPAGQTCTRFGFRAVSTATGDPSVGNLLDDAGFQVAAPASPSPRPSVRITPPVTAAIGADPGPGTGSSGLVLLLLAGIGLAVGGWRLARGTRRSVS
jgi:hypothetical protein